MFGASFGIGLGIGLCTGLVVGVGSGISAGISMEKKRIGRRLGDLVLGQEWRVQQRDGSPVQPQGVLTRLGLPSA